MPNPDTTGGPANYSAALAALAVLSTDGTVLTPNAVLAHYSDGWRMIARFSKLGPNVRATSYTVEPIKAVKIIEATNDA